jgi:hypothetical protein
VESNNSDWRFPIAKSTGLDDLMPPAAEVRGGRGVQRDIAVLVRGYAESMRTLGGALLIVIGILLLFVGGAVFSATAPVSPLIDALGAVGFWGWWLFILAGIVVLRGKFGAGLGFGCLGVVLFFTSVNLAFQAYDRPTAGRIALAALALSSLVATVTLWLRALRPSSR